MGYFESGRIGKSVPEIDVQQRELLEMVVESVDRFLADQQDNFGDWDRVENGRVVGYFAGYYNRARTHLSLMKDAPESSPIHGPRQGRIVSKRHCGGLHHEYRRRAA